MASYPKGLPSKYRYHWANPWTEKSRKALGFRRWLKAHGYLTPHFRTSDAHSKDGVKVPARMSYACRQHAFRLEKFRHAVGDKPLPVLSWYRSPARNRAAGGASKSVHMKAIACDFDKSTVDKVGRNRWFAVADVIFHNGGVGNYPGGNSHLDSRGYRARWRSF